MAASIGGKPLENPPLELEVKEEKIIKLQKLTWKVATVAIAVFGSLLLGLILPGFLSIPIAIGAIGGSVIPFFVKKLEEHDVSIAWRRVLHLPTNDDPCLKQA